LFTARCYVEVSLFVLQASLRWVLFILPNDTGTLKRDDPSALVAHFQTGETLMFALGFNINLRVGHVAMLKPKPSNRYKRIFAAQRTCQPVPSYLTESSFAYMCGLVHSGIRKVKAAAAAAWYRWSSTQ
jgi:hypothetical protein